MTADVVACNGTLVNAPIYLLALPTNTLPATTHANEAPFYPSTFSFVPVPVRAQDVTCLVGDKTVVASYKLLFDPLAPPVMGHGAKDLLPVAQEAPLSVPTPDAGTLSWNATQLGQEMAAALGPRSLAPNALDIMQNAGLLFGSALVLLYLLPKGLRDTFAARQRSGASGAEDNG